MLYIKRFFIALALVAFVYSTFYPAFSQTRRKRVVREKLSRVEIYMDGGYYMNGMSAANDGFNAGSAYLEDVLNLYDWEQLISPGDITHANDKLENWPTFGGGINLNLNHNFGVGVKFMFGQVSGSSEVILSLEDIPILVRELNGEIQVDVMDAYTTDTKYHVAPILLNGYYRWNPIPRMKILTLTAGAGAGLYTTSIEFNHAYMKDVSSYSAYLNPPGEFYDFTRRYVAKPFGGYVFAGADIMGSAVVSINFNLEYHFVPDYDIAGSDWGNSRDILAYPSILEDFGEFYESYYQEYTPAKLNLSGLRFSAGMKFAF